MKFKYGHTLCCLLLVVGGLHAEIKLPSMFGDHMVMQRNSEAAIWGEAEANSEVKIIASWDDRVYTQKSNKNGEWKVKVTTPEAGGPHTISIKNNNHSRLLKDVLIGEVWVCAGQSNMAMAMKGLRNQPVLDSNRDVAVSTNENIRLFNVGNNISDFPLKDFKGQWKKCIPQNVVQFSAVAYHYGKLLNEALDVPIGLITSCQGGTKIEPWISRESIERFDFVAENKEDGYYGRRKPASLYNAMIHPMAGYVISGVIWYQGESNMQKPNQYEELLPGLIRDWRAQWGIGDFGFYYVQIAPFNYGEPGNSAFIRDAMRKVSLQEIPNIGMVSLMDIGQQNNIHIADKKTVGERLAFLALNKTYGLSGIEYSGPVLREMVAEGKLLKLYFDHAENGLTSYGKPLTQFEIAGENKRFFKAKGIITREGVVLQADRVTEPVYVKYAFEDFIKGELFNTEGLPASSFRTDDWEE